MALGLGLALALALALGLGLGVSLGFEFEFGVGCWVMDFLVSSHISHPTLPFMSGHVDFYFDGAQVGQVQADVRQTHAPVRR